MDFRRLRRTTLGRLRRLDWAPPLLARRTIGAIFVPTGWGKLHNLPDIVSFFRELGIPYPEIQAPFVSSIELVCGGLVLVGLATRLAAVPLIGTMVVAIATAVWPQLESWREIFGKEELHYMVLLTYLGVSGPGPVALDGVIARRLPRPVARDTGRPGLSPAAERTPASCLRSVRDDEKVTPPSPRMPHAPKPARACRLLCRAPSPRGDRTPMGPRRRRCHRSRGSSVDWASRASSA